MTEQEIREIARQAMREVVTAKNTDDRMGALEERVDKIGNALNEINEKLSGSGDGKNAALEGKESPEEEKEEKKEEELSAENAKPSQEMIKAFATASNVDFCGKTPSFATLAGLAGIKEADPVARIAAVNAKFKEMQSATPATGAAANASMEVF